MEQLEQLGQAAFATIITIVMISVFAYGLLLIVGGPFSQSPEWANAFAAWCFKKLAWLLGQLVILPFWLMWLFASWLLKKITSRQAKKQRK